MSKYTERWYYNLGITVLIILSSAAVFFLLAKWGGLRELTINDMMVSFVGIIATFIVIGNYAQVEFVKKDCENAITQVKSDNQQLRNAVEALLKDSKEYQSAERLLRDVHMPLNAKRPWRLYGHKKDGDLQLYEELVYIGNVSADNQGTFIINYIDENGHSYIPQLVDQVYLDTTETISFYATQCDLQSERFKFVLAYILKNEKH